MNDNLVLFFDGCHKIYYCELSDTDTIEKMKEYSYEPITGDFSKNLADLWRKSCPLKFVDHADFEAGAPTVPQCELSKMRGFRTRLSDYYRAKTTGEHGQWVCPLTDNASALPDEDNNCSLCGLRMVAGYPERKGND